MSPRILLVSFVTVALGACAAQPLVIDEGRVLRSVAAGYHDFYPAAGDPDVDSDAGLLRPRFGIPAIAQTGAAFDVELLERGVEASPAAALLLGDVTSEEAAACMKGFAVAGCYPLALSRGLRSPVNLDSAVVRYTAQPLGSPPAGGYDLYVTSVGDAPVRAPRGVWLRADDPNRIARVRVALLSDLHVGKHHRDVEAHLHQVIADVNAGAPDLVVITGDIVNRGDSADLPPRARDLLLGIDAPVLVVLGNHDLGFSARPMFGKSYGLAWSNFARAFHSYLFFRMSLGGYDFVGFDSGPSVPSPRVLTRGLAPETLEHLRTELSDARREGQRGVVLFSHAPSRASLSDDSQVDGPGHFGQMRRGREEFETLLLEAAAQGQRVLHLAGHTHWSDVFEAQPGGANFGLHFARWPIGAMSACPTRIEGKAAMVNIQSASHAGIALRETGRGYGFAWLTLGDGAAEIAFRRYGIPGWRTRCDESVAAQ